ncbi:uncharacterized protein LOC123552768 [Mercenaria mercenaria]|uniref:uncharacterized protein LOC123552768 n=1 Tax=Mercenaria mercenaria TaxID=6596 RepID=UPI00234F7E09|nr:uncharacterized protein LOC123552768 [Mercenaria mercenaria]
MSANEQENNCESIHQYVQTHNSTDPEINILCQKWMKLCEELDINLQYVRSKMDDWFVEVYRSRDHLDDRVEDIATGISQTRKFALYWKFLDDFEKVISEETEVINKIQMAAAGEKIKETFGHHREDWVDLAVQCVCAEVDLLSNYSTARMQTVQIQKAIQKIEKDINSAGQLQAVINDNLKTFQSNVSALRDLYENKEEKEQHLRDYQVVRPALQRQNGSVPDQQYFKSQIDQIGRDINKFIVELLSLQQKVSQTFEDLYDVLKELVDNLKSNVKEWQREFKFNYAELVASPDLDKIAPWCALTGQIIHEVLHGSIVTWQNILTSVQNEIPGGDCQIYIQNFQTILTDFIQSTFVVTEQGNFFIKTGNKRFPKFSVRVLAADRFSKHSEVTTAHFISEDDLKQCLHGRDRDLNVRRLEKFEKKLKSNSIKFSAENGKDKMECCFQNLQFAQSFKRSNKEINKQVHEEKYRVIFVTQMESATCWTMSLPLVVTTASNQEAHSLASIMWQCYSTDVYSPGSDIPEELPWSEVGEMLQMKMARLSTQHRLSPENIKHLKDRLFGDENTPDDESVTLTQFCWNYMQDTEFSFWKWFLGVYNLIEQYLQPFWIDGLIMGFVKKETAEQMLERCDQAGTFILRFSDKHFTNSDGRKSVYGRLTSCVIVMKEVKGNKRNSSSQLEPIKKRVIEHVDVADFKKLGGELKKQETDDGSKNNLANILKETWIKGRDGQSQVQMYRYLYPSGKPREELFDKYCEEASTVSGYRHTREAYIAILEQAMTKVSLSKPEGASVSSLGSDMSVQFGAVCTKRPRRSRDNADKIKRSPRRSSSCQSNISSPQGSPYQAQSPQSHSQSPFHATQSPGPPPISPVYPTQSPYPMSSPAQSVPSPAFSFHQQTSQNVDSMVPSSDEKSLLPTFITEGFPVSSTSSRIESQTSRILNKTLPSDNFQTAASVAVSGFDAMEISSEMSENQSFARELFSPEATLVTDSISTSTEWEVFPKREDNVTLTEVMPMGGTVLSKEGGNMSFSGNHMRGIQVMSQGGESMTAAESGFCETGENTEVVFIVTQNNGQFGLNIGESKEQQPNITSTMSSRPVPELANYQILGLTQAQFQQVQTWVEENRIAAETVLQNTQSRAVDTGIGDTPVSTSSGSSSGLFEYSANQLAAMGSGDIDPNFASSIVGQDSQDGN